MEAAGGKGHTVGRGQSEAPAAALAVSAQLCAALDWLGSLAAAPQ